MTKASDLLFVGTTGCFHNHWKGSFYPKDATGVDLLRCYCQHFRTLVMPESFYHLPQEATLKKWLEATDEGFLFSMQANRLITHSRKLRDVDGLLHAFLDRISTMGSQLAPTLFQLPHSMEKDTALLRDFLALLPGDRESVMEFRHASWFDDEVLMCLREHRVGYCIVSAPRLPVRIEVTAPFAYIRLHGKRRWFTDNYTDEDLEWWAREVRHILDQGTRVFAYFANDEDAAAVFNAKKFEQLLSP